MAVNIGNRPILMNRLLLVAGVFAYLVLTFLIAGGVLWLTLWAYASAGESLSKTTSAAVLNTAAATLLWLAFFGGLDMFLTIWTIMQNRQMEVERAAREAERTAREEAERATREVREEAERTARASREEAERTARTSREEAERAARAQELADQRAFQQGIIEMLTAERNNIASNGKKAAGNGQKAAGSGSSFWQRCKPSGNGVSC